MKKPSWFLRVLGVAGLLGSLLAVTIVPIAAQQDLPGSGPTEPRPQHFHAGNNSIYYPWVANDDDFGLGSADTSISVQNLEDRDGQLWIYRGTGDDSWELVVKTYLSAYASKTLSAFEIGLEEGEGAPVAVRAYQPIPKVVLPDVPTSGHLVEAEIVLSKPAGVTGDFTQVVVCVVDAYRSTGAYAGPYPFTAATDGPGFVAGDPVEWTNPAELQEILDSVNPGPGGQLVNPFGGLNADGDCLDAYDEFSADFLDSLIIGGVAKMAAGGSTLPMTGIADTAVSGYNAVNGTEIDQFNQWYLPIVQTNCGPGGCWESTLRVANLDDLKSAVTVRFFAADDGSGSLQTSFQLQKLVNGGETWNIDLGNYVPDGWVGSAHILSDGWVFAMVDRFKPGYGMWLTNTGSAANFENTAQNESSMGRYALFAPHVLMDYYGWNTGINVANLVDAENHVSIQYFNMLGNATQTLDQRLAAHGMTYFYDPGTDPLDDNRQEVTDDPNAGVVGSAIIWSDHPVAVAVDATKYPDTDANGGLDLFQATSYSAIQNIYTWQAIPLAQKGDPVDGMGATSGINIMNPNSTAATANVYWVDPSGFNAANSGISSVTIPAFANGFIYSMTQHNLPNGFHGAAQVVSDLPVAAVSANVDYAVDGDGSAIYNAFNHCGYYRTAAPQDAVESCFLGDPLDVTGGSVTKTFVDEDGQPIPGVQFHISGDNPAFPYQRHGISGVTGTARFTNVPAGSYELHVDTVPAQYLLPESPADVFTLLEGDEWAATNELLWSQGFSKTVCLADDSNPDEVACSDINLADVNVVVYESIGEDTAGAPVAGDIVFEGVTGPAGTVSGHLPVGDYILCVYDEDGVATTTNGETVHPLIPDQVSSIELCIDESPGAASWGDLFSVAAGEVITLENPVWLQGGATNIFVGTQGDTNTLSLQSHADNLTPRSGIEVCLEDTVSEVEKCSISNSHGWVTFFIEPGETTPEEIAGEDGVRDYIASVFSDQYCLVTAEGGEETATISQIRTCDHVGFFSTTLQNHHLNWAGEFHLSYDPTKDVTQDGYLDDLLDGGTWDVVIEMEPHNFQDG